MAIGRLTVGTGGKGKAVSHAAYVARTGAYEKYLEKGEVLEAQGAGNMPAWAEHDPSVFWTAADAYERANGTTYREYLVSLPRELSADQRVELVEAFVAQELGERHAYQYAIHVPKASDGLDNPHVHLMFSERRNDGIARDPDQYFKRYNAKSPEKGGAQKGVGEIPHSQLTKQAQTAELKAMRSRWETLANQALEKAGRSERISMKSYWERGLDIQPEPKQLPSAWKKNGMRSILEFRKAREAELAVRRDPGLIIERVSSMKATFTRADLYRELNKVTDDVEMFNAIKAKLDVHPDLIEVDRGDQLPYRNVAKEELTTQSSIDSEMSIRALGDVLSAHGESGLATKTVDGALAAQPILSEEQVSAVRHVTGDAQLSMIAGVAGAGKSTTLSVVRAGYEAEGFRVSGMALAGKAAEELQQSSGIESRTIASWLYRFDQGEIQLTKKDVVVLDEAGMVNNATMERVLDAVNQSGAKVILVGDAEQLQPIQAGCPFRTLSEKLGVAEIATVRRQYEAWQRNATRDLSTGRGKAALAAYRDNGCVHEAPSEELVGQVVENYLSKTEDSAVILAHRNVDVGMLNAAVRDERKARGELQQVKVAGAGQLELGVGDRVVFLKNDAGLGVKNGQFGEVVRMNLLGSGLSVKLDNGRTVEFSLSTYQDVAHGYASTIHKSQGMTVDRAMLWGSASLDRHLGYVAMSRHRDRLDVYQPHEASRVRKLESCLSRSTREVSMQTMMQERGLEYAQGRDGRVRLSKVYPSAAEVDQAKAVRAEAIVTARNEIDTHTAQLTQAAKEAATSLAEHRANEPPGRRFRDALKPGANQRWVDWQGREMDLAREARVADRQLKKWTTSVERQGQKTTMLRERLNRLQPDLLSKEGGIERQADGRIVITDRYPEIARDKATSILSGVETDVRVAIERKSSGYVDDLERAETRLEHHRRQKPVDSKFEVFLYREATERRDDWNAQIPVLEAEVQQAKDTISEWEDTIKDGRYEKDRVWQEFSVKAPNAADVNAMVLSADRQRVKFAKELRDYYRLEKQLESNLGRALHKDLTKKRDGLLKEFAWGSYQKRLPKRIRVQAKKHRESVREAEALKRSLSRGRGLGR